MQAGHRILGGKQERTMNATHPATGWIPNHIQWGE